MTNDNNFEIIIIGGSYAGLSAAMALGRSLRNVLIIDSDKPCNRKTPHSHNFITQDGETPKAIADKAREQVLKYDSVKFHSGLATEAVKTKNGFEVRTEKGDTFSTRKIIFATGVTDIMLPLEGFSACWGISVLHCPYCHGYEVKGKKTGILANGDMGVEFAKLINNWTKDLTLFTNGKSTLSEEQTRKLSQQGIPIIEKEIVRMEHNAGYITHLTFTDGSRHEISALYARPAFKQHCNIPETLGCELTEVGFIKVDDLQKTTLPGVYAAGDNTTSLRAVAAAVSAGTKAGAALNKELIDESF